MDFIDNQAEESDGDSSVASGSDTEPKIKKRKLKEKSKKKKVVASSDEDDDDEDDEGMEEMKDFIADEDEDDGDDDAKSDKSGKSKDEDSELDDDDLDLLDENLDRQRSRTNNRVELADSDEDDQRRIERDIFQGDAGDDDARSERSEPERRERGRRHSGDEYSDSERSEDNFIEDDGDGPRRPRKRKGDDHMPEGAEDDARDVFGVEDFNFDEFYDDDDGDDAEDEEEEIIEDDGEGGEIRIRRKKDTSKKTTLLESIEPSELERGFLSAADKKIMIEDAPERFQLRRTPVTECDEDEFEKESKWIFKYAFDTSTITNQSCTYDYDRLDNVDTSDDYVRNNVIAAIREALRFIRVKTSSFEVPFIGFYRKESVENRLTLNNLWRVYDFDEKWCHMTERKNKLVELTRRMKNYQENGDDVLASRRPIGEAEIMDLEYAETMEQLTDMHANFQLLYGASLEAMMTWEKKRRAEEEGDVEDDFKAKFKASIRNDKYQMCVENGIGELAGRFGLTARQFAENLDWKKHEVEQDEEMPLDAADAYICSAFPDRETVLAGAKFMLAKEISRQPAVREKVRREFRHSAKFFARPTKKGRDTMDDSHPMFEKRYIFAKPINKIEGEDFLYYDKMEKEKLIEMQIECDTDEDKASKNTLADKILIDQPFHKDEYTQLVEEWNTVRSDCVRMAIDEMLIPYMKDECRSSMFEEARMCVVKKCRQSFAKRIETSGYIPPKTDDDDDDDDDIERHGSVRIMAVVYPTTRDEASFGVMVDENGVVVDYLRMVHFTKKFGGPGHTRELKAESMDLFKKFVQRRRPHAIGLNIEDLDCQRLKRDLEKAIDELLNDSMISKRPPIFLMDNEVAKVYMRSNTSLVEHPDYPPILRQAVSLARCLQDPLPEHAHLWNADEDIFCLSLHPLQREVDQEQLASILLHELMNRVNQCGVDVNKCVEFPHYTNMLQFVSGLGPRKATSLLKNIKLNDNMIESRTKLVTACKLGPKVFMNCAGFIRIDTAKVMDKTDAYVEVLDGSRVHPETYEWARKMAVDALEVDDSADPTTALTEIMESPDRLKDLDLDAFAEELNRQGFGEKKATLYDISNELSARYKDLRDNFEEPGPEQLFDLISRSGKEIKEGQRVLGTVQAVQYKRVDHGENEPLPETNQDGVFSCPYCKSYTSEDPGNIQEHMSKNDRNGGCPGTPVGIKVRLDNGFLGFCPCKNMSKDRVDNPLDRVTLNKPYYFRVMNVNKEKFSYFLSCRSSDLQQSEGNERDPYWDDDMYTADQDEIKSEAVKKKAANTRVKRVISHPNFHNVSYEAATKMLDSLDWSECIIRPSAHKDSSLSVTWKISNRVYHNFFVKETAKDQVFSIGRQLSVGDEDFEDLNELVARFVQPMIQISHEITTHKYFCDEATCEDLPEIEEYVRQKKKELGRNPYAFSASYKRPCQFCISYMFDTSGRIRHEYFMIHPRGVRFRHQNFESLDHMMGWFKKHFNERPIDQMRSRHHHHAPPSSHHYSSGPPSSAGHHMPPLPPMPPQHHQYQQYA